MTDNGRLLGAVACISGVTTQTERRGLGGSNDECRERNEVHLLLLSRAAGARGIAATAATPAATPSAAAQSQQQPLLLLYPEDIYSVLPLHILAGRSSIGVHRFL